MRWSVPGPASRSTCTACRRQALAEVLLDLYFQPGKLPDSLADMLRGYISERLIIRPKSP